MAIISGDIEYGVLYIVTGASITYNSTTVTAGNTFRGVIGFKTFTGSGVVDEILELQGSSVEYVQNSEDQAFSTVISSISAMAVEFMLTDAEKVVNEATKITGMALELVDYPFYVFPIIETRL